MRLETAQVFATTEEWLEARQQGIGASESAAVRGASPYSGPLDVYTSKVHPNKEDKNSDAILAGHLLEETVSRIHEEQTGAEVFAPTDFLEEPFTAHALWHHPERPFILATPERIVTDADRGAYLLEIKTVGPHTIREWAKGPPLYVRIQVQQQLDVLGVDECDVRMMPLSDEARSMAVAIGKQARIEGWNVAEALHSASSGWRTECYTIERDDEYLREHNEALAEFWDHVQRQKPPKPSDADDVAKLLKRIWPEEDPSRSVDLADAQSEHLLARLYQAMDAEKVAKKEKERLRTRMMQMMGDAANLLCAGQVVGSWKKSTTNYAAKAASTVTTRKFSLSRRRVVFNEGVASDLPGVN